ncbi:hypothetical protein SNE40_015032 [Patella caerulea]|uniref:Uncharacterized protein n=1 Tax=Patella caerulea TaxID=87958 RepID=A0AAN8JGX3_PATCE
MSYISGTSTSDTVCSSYKDELVSPSPSSLSPSSTPSLMRQTATRENNNPMFPDFTPTTESKRRQNKSISNQSQEIRSRGAPRSTGKPKMEMVLTLAPSYSLVSKDKKTITRGKDKRVVKRKGNGKKRHRCHNVNKLGKTDKKRCRDSRITRKREQKTN